MASIVLVLLCAYQLPTYNSSSLTVSWSPPLLIHVLVLKSLAYKEMVKIFRIIKITLFRNTKKKFTWKNKEYFEHRNRVFNMLYIKNEHYIS